MDIIESFAHEADKLKQRIRRLEEMSNAIIDFNKRYVDLINVPEGYFGVLSDEIIVLVMSYCHIDYIIMPLCTRLRSLCNESLKLKFAPYTRNYDHFAIAYCIDIIFTSYVKFYYYLFKFYNTQIKVDSNNSLILEYADNYYVIHKDQTVDISISNISDCPIKMTKTPNTVKICYNDINIVFANIDNYFIHTQYKGAYYTFGTSHRSGNFEKVYETFVKKYKKSL
jgi:hypothetical protein